MKFGICTSIDKIDVMQRTGFDYIEASASTVAQMTDEEFAKAVEQVKNAKIGVECFNVLFPKELSLLGKNADWSKIEPYLKKAFARIKELGGKTVVFGSGKCRSFGKDISFAEAHRQLVDITRKIGMLAAEYGITVVIEPLNRSETNVINTVAEGAMLAADVNLVNVQLLADSYHMFKENESMENIARAGELAHTHVALLNGRGYPIARDPMLEGFFNALSKAGYHGTMSIEGNSSEMEAEAATALSVLRDLAAEFESLPVNS